MTRQRSSLGRWYPMPADGGQAPFWMRATRRTTSGLVQPHALRLADHATQNGAAERPFQVGTLRSLPRMGFVPCRVRRSTTVVSGAGVVPARS